MHWGMHVLPSLPPASAQNRRIGILRSHPISIGRAWARRCAIAFPLRSSGSMQDESSEPWYVHRHTTLRHRPRRSAPRPAMHICSRSAGPPAGPTRLLPSPTLYMCAAALGPAPRAIQCVLKYPRARPLSHCIAVFHVPRPRVAWMPHMPVDPVARAFKPQASAPQPIARACATARLGWSHICACGHT